MVQSDAANITQVSQEESTKMNLHETELHRITIVTQDCSVVGDVAEANCTDVNDAGSDGEVHDEAVIDAAKAHDVVGEERVPDGTAPDGNVPDSVAFEHIDCQAVECESYE